VARYCNPSYAGDIGQENHASRPVRAKSLHLNQCLGTVVYTCHPKLSERLRCGGWQFQANPDKKVCMTPSQWKKAGQDGTHLSSQQPQVL
jgi:hypothetical protein